MIGAPPMYIAPGDSPTAEPVLDKHGRPIGTSASSAPAAALTSSGFKAAARAALVGLKAAPPAVLVVQMGANLIAQPVDQIFPTVAAAQPTLAALARRGGVGYVGIFELKDGAWASSSITRLTPGGGLPVVPIVAAVAGVGLIYLLTRPRGRKGSR